MGIKPIDLKDLVKGEFYFLRYIDDGDNYWTFGNISGAIVKFLDMRNHLIQFRIYKGCRRNEYFNVGNVVWEEVDTLMLYSVTKEDINAFAVDLL